MKVIIFILLSFIILPIERELAPSASSETCLTMEEQRLYNLIMEYRKSKNLPAIPYSAKLSQVAQVHVRDLADNYDFSSNNRCNPHSWSKKGKWSACCYTSDHKKASCMWDKPREIAGYTGDGFEIAYYSSKGASAQEGIDGWIKSPSHNPLLINLGTWKQVTWEAIGIGIYKEYGVVWFGMEKDESTMVVCK